MVMKRAIIFGLAILLGIGVANAQILPQIFFHKSQSGGGGGTGLHIGIDLNVGAVGSNVL
jgi:hypothetical protein